MYRLVSIEINQQHIFVELETNTRIRAKAEMIEGKLTLKTTDQRDIDIHKALSKEQIEDLIYLLQRAAKRRKQ